MHERWLQFLPVCNKINKKNSQQQTIIWKLLIVEMLSEKCIIGSDFMSANDVSINFGT
jgi:hypothetical protein